MRCFIHEGLGLLAVTLAAGAAAVCWVSPDLFPIYGGAVCLIKDSLGAAGGTQL